MSNNLSESNKGKFTITIIESNEIQFYFNKELIHSVKGTISFKMNDIEIGNDDGIPLIENILKEPNERKSYEIEYAGKEYKLSDEALFELVVELFRKKIEYENIIEEIELFFPIENETLLNRMMNAITGLEGEEYEQRKKLNKILDVHERYSQWKRRIEKNRLKVEWNKP